MEWYKLRTSKVFLAMMIVVFAVNGIIAGIVPIISRLITQISNTNVAIVKTPISDIFASPFSLSLLMLALFISVVSFLYSDFSDGYIKSIIGQVNSRSSYITANMIVVILHNCAFFVVAFISNLIGCLVSGTLSFDGTIGAGIGTMLIKLLISVALCSILMFIAMALRNKTFAIVVGVLVSTSAFSLLYMGIDAGLSNLFHIENFNLANYMPDSLFNSVNIAEGSMVANGIAVGLVCTVLFMFLTYYVFNKRDIK